VFGLFTPFTTVVALTYGSINDYWASVVLIHFMREGDQKMSVSDLVRKYPYERAKEIVISGWK